MAPAARSTRASVWPVWTGVSGAEAGTRPAASRGSTGPAGGGGADDAGEFVDTGTAAAAAAPGGTLQFADHTGRRGRVDRPPQTRAGTASWPACVLRDEEEVVGLRVLGREDVKR